MSKKIKVSPSQMFHDSFTLANYIYQSNFVPDIILSVWRGGSIPGICISEFFNHYNIHPITSVVKASSYDNNNQQRTCKLEFMNDFTNQWSYEKNLLIVDDIFDTGQTMSVITKRIKVLMNPYSKPINIKIATLWNKPLSHKYNIAPDYYVKMALPSEWIVFPHENEKVISSLCQPLF